MSIKVWCGGAVMAKKKTRQKTLDPLPDGNPNLSNLRINYQHRRFSDWFKWQIDRCLNETVESKRKTKKMRNFYASDDVASTSFSCVAFLRRRLKPGMLWYNTLGKKTNKSSNDI